ncbi:MAG: lipoate--protein ligase [Oscillospiraceae bacterium]|nr:lipoate--protein ligase [Oscillospiraceae bacterium]
MLTKLLLLKTGSTNPYYNLALEEQLLRGVGAGECILYLWQNRRTVVIGRNQNAEDECRVQALEADGGHLARRLSGGGAVYHDLGNLNFTFLTTAEDYDTARQTQVILQAVRSLGVDAERTGRNDLTADGRKFSGHAFYKTAGRGCHHGTLMVNVEREQMGRYLQVSPLKLRAKGVQSVRSRVVNLAEIAPTLTVEKLSAALESAFGEVYALPVTPLAESELDAAAVEEKRKRFASPDWLYGKLRPLQCSREARFDWGTVRLDFSLAEGVICDAALWSDGLEADYLSAVPEALRGCALEENAVRGRLTAPDGAHTQAAADIAALLTTKRGES